MFGCSVVFVCGGVSEMRSRSRDFLFWRGPLFQWGSLSFIAVTYPDAERRYRE